MVDVRIGIIQTAKELEIELPEGADTEAVKAELAAAIAGETVAWIADRKGRQVGVPGARIAYVEVGRPDDGRRIGFGG